MTVYEDASLPHQIRVDFEEHHGEIFVTCNCQRDEDGRYTPLAEPGGTHRQRIDAYKAHLEKVNRP
jgi:hypothetical protein